MRNSLAAYIIGFLLMRSEILDSKKWCGPCKALAPLLDRIADDYQGKIKVYAVDIDDSPKMVKKYSVKSVPTVIAFEKGEKKGQSVGLTSRENLVKLVGF